jgi:hypothetical protein
VTGQQINLADIPAVNVDTARLREAARPLVPLGFDAQDQAKATMRAWQAAQPFYVAPEAPTLLAALNPVGPIVLRISERLSVASRALITYADTAEPLIAELERLRATPEPAGPGAGAGREAQIERLVAELLAAERACAAAIQAVAENPGFTGAPDKTKVSEHSDKAGVTIKVGVIKVGGNHAFTVTEFSDGSVAVTFADSRELAATGGFGGTIGSGRNGVATKVELEPGLALSLGDTWEFDDLEAAEPMLAELHDYAYRKQLSLDPDFAPGVVVADVVKPLQIPPPDVTVTDFGPKLQGGAKFGPGQPGTADPGAGLTLNGEVKTSVEHNSEDGSTTTTTSSEDSAALAATVSGQGGGGPQLGLDGKGTLAASTALTHDASGELTKITLSSTHESAGKFDASGGLPDAPAGKGKDTDSVARLTTRTASLEVTDRNRQIVEQALADRGGDLGELLSSPETFYPERAVDGDALEQVLHTNATVTETDYEKSVSKDGFEAEGKAGVGVGVDVGPEITDVRATRSTYLGPPGPDGVRRPVDVPGGVPEH